MREERRRKPRWIPRAAALADARIRAGSAARILNCSEDGIQLSTSMRLLPGRRCTIAWPAVDGQPAAPGAIVRCSVGRITDEGIAYHAAVRLDAAAAFLREDDTRGG
jgi:hypothetical protein